jgi:hypothetical protein
MGAAASLFFSSNDSEKQTLHKRITPSSEQFDEQQDRWNALADYLITDLKERSGCAIRTWLQGSYKSATQIRPIRSNEEFDIDLGVYFLWPGLANEGVHSAQALKSFVQASLKAYAEANRAAVVAVTEPKPRCCRIKFCNDFHIDVPAYHLDSNEVQRTLATESGWQSSDPKAIYLWFRNQFDDTVRFKVRRQIRYLKSSAGLKFRNLQDRPTSILLTVLVADAAISLANEGISADDDALRDIVQRIIERFEKNKTVLNPVDNSEDLVRLSQSLMTTFTDRLKTLFDVAELATKESTEFGAADVWQRSFEHLFPVPEMIRVNKQLPVQYATPQVIVRAVSKDNAARQFHGTNQIGPIPKNCALTFSIANAYAIPGKAQIVWTVRNKGREAENTNDLGHCAGIGFSAEEKSAYKGRHYMDCMVRVEGRTIAMRRVPVDIMGQEMPRRNPISRPSYTRLNGKL